MNMKSIIALSAGILTLLFFGCSVEQPENETNLQEIVVIWDIDTAFDNATSEEALLIEDSQITYSDLITEETVLTVQRVEIYYKMIGFVELPDMTKSQRDNYVRCFSRTKENRSA